MGSDIERRVMEKRNKRLTARENRQRADWVAGFTLRLAADEKERVLDDLTHGGPDMNVFLQELGAVGIKTSVSYDRKKDGYTVTIFRNDPEFPDAGYTLSSQGRTIERCVQALIFALKDVQDFNILEIVAARESLEDRF